MKRLASGQQGHPLDVWSTAIKAKRETISGLREAPVVWGWLYWLIGPFIALIATNQWFTPGSLLGGGDNFPSTFPNPDNWLRRLPYSWDLTGIGGPTSLIQNAPHIITIWLLRFVLSPSGAQHLLYTFLITAQLLSMMLLILTILPEHRVAALLGALFYVFNPGTVIVPPGFTGMFVAAFLPCLGAVLVRAAIGPLKRGRLLAFAVVAACSGLLFTNPPTFAILLIYSSLLVMYIAARQWSTKRKVVLRLALLMGLALLVNAYWLADGYLLLRGYVSNGTGGLASSVDNWGAVSQRSSILNMFWLNSTWAWDAYFPYSVDYRTPLLLAVVFMPTLLAFSALLNRAIPRYIVFPTSIIALITLFLSTGQHQPWAAINLFLFHHVPLFWLFREPNTKFPAILLIAYAILVGYQAEWVVRLATRAVRQRVKAIARIGSALVFAGIFLLSGFPLVTGASVGRGYSATEKIGFAIPQYWYDLGQYLARGDVADGVLLLPNDDYYQMRYTWGYYGLDGVANEMIYNHVIPLGGELGYVSTTHNSSITGKVLRMLQSDSHRSIVPYLAALGTRYIVQRNDIDATEPNRHVATPSQVRAFLMAQHGIHFVRSFGLLDLYEVDRQYYVPPVYAVSVPRTDMATGHALAQRMTRDLIDKLGLTPTGDAPTSFRAPQVMHIAVTRESQVRYSIQVSSTQGPSLLILSTSYHPSWHACLVPAGSSPSPWTCTFRGSLPAQDHVPVLGFLNGWVIDHPGRYTLIVDYGFQHIADIGSTISVITLGVLLLSCLLLFYNSMFRRQRLALPGDRIRKVALVNRAH